MDWSSDSIATTALLIGVPGFLGGVHRDMRALSDECANELPSVKHVSPRWKDSLSASLTAMRTRDLVKRRVVRDSGRYRRPLDIEMRVFLAFVAMCFSSLVYAKDFNNGCGSGWNEPIIPDRIKILCVDFRTACAAHDNCYSKCEEGEENFDKPICEQKNPEQKEGRRGICDSDFREILNNGCNGCNIVQKPMCMGVAALYFVGVSIGGGGSFNGKEIPESYYDFLMSDNVQNFDFDAFVTDIERQYRESAIHGSNELRFSIEKGIPSAKFERIQIETESNGDWRREEGRIMQELEAQRFRNLQRLAPTGP